MLHYRNMRGAQKRCFYYWFDLKSKPLKAMHQQRTTNISKYTATYPNAQELPNNTFSFHRRAREIQMLADKQHANAQTALLQFNVMVRQKVRPNVHTYTSLISIMAKAKMELTAFKLFNRMLQQKITPIPETYQALLLATSPMRSQLHEDIQRKLYACMQTQPSQLIKKRSKLIEEAKAASQTYLEELVTDDPERIAEMNLQKELQAISPFNSIEEFDPDSSNATVYVDSLRKAFYGNEWENAGKNKLTPQQKKLLAPKLGRLSSMELQMFLTIHRQERTGDRGTDILAILDNVQEGYIFEMLKQREQYVETMKTVLEQNTALSDQVELAITDPDDPVEEQRKIFKASRGEVKVVRRKKKKKSSGKQNGEEGEMRKGSVQGGVQLTGKYKLNYVKLAKNKQLGALSIKQLKAFEQGERFKDLGLTVTGTKAQHIFQIEKYLFGKGSEVSEGAVPPESTKGRGRVLQLHDKRDDDGEEPEFTEDEENLNALLQTTPYAFDSRLVTQMRAPGGYKTRFKLQHTPLTRTHRLEKRETVMRPRLTAKDQRFLYEYGKAARLESFADDTLRSASTEHHRDLYDPYLKLKNNKFGLWASRPSIRKLLEPNYLKKQAEQTQDLLKPLRDYMKTHK